MVDRRPDSLLELTSGRSAALPILARVNHKEIINSVAFLCVVLHLKLDPLQRCYLMELRNVLLHVRHFENALVHLGTLVIKHRRLAWKRRPLQPLVVVALL